MNKYEKPNIKNILVILDDRYNDNIKFFIKCISLNDFSKYNIYLYSINLKDERINLIKNNFKNVNLLKHFNEKNTFSTVISESLNALKLLPAAFKVKNINYFIYSKSKTDIKIIDKSITYVTCLDLSCHLQNTYIYNVDDNCSYKVLNNEKLVLIKNKNKNFEHYLFVNNYILKNIDISNSNKEYDNEFLLEEINNKGYYSSDGIIKCNNLFYYKIKNKIEKININELIYKLNGKIDKIYYENFENIDNLVLENNLQLHFTILILSYNTSKYVNSNLSSVLNQKYNNFDVIFINCQSTDNTAKLAYNIGRNYNNFYLFNNTQRCYQTENFLLGSFTARKNSIIVSVDGDDWLYDDNVLSKLNMIYLAKRCLMTYGLYVEFPYREVNFARTDKINIIKENKFRAKSPYSVSHLRTWKRELILNINHDDLLYNDEFPKMAGDIAVLPYMIEMSHDRACFISDRLYVYNGINENSDHNINIDLQRATGKYFSNKKPYNRIDKFNKIIELDKLNKFFIPSHRGAEEEARRKAIIINKLFELNYEDEVFSYKYLFYNFWRHGNPSYFMDSKIYDFNKLDLIYKISPVLTNNIELIPNLKIDLLARNILNKKAKLCKYGFNEKLEISLNQDKIYDYLENYFINNKLNFDNIKFYNKFFTNDADINIIIPVQNRTENLNCLVQNLLNIDYYGRTRMITVVEMNNNKHKDMCFDNQVNYLSFNCDKYKFNKALCANFLYYIYEKNNINYKYLIFQDVDCIVNNDFIKNIFKFNDFENKFIQPYKQNRVLYTTQKLANSIRTGQIDINKIDENTKDIIVPTRGSPGGSIFMKKDFFENVGGLDYYYFCGYGPEDIYFYIKLLTLYECDNNNFSNIIHLWHESLAQTTNVNTFKFINLYLYLDINTKKKLLDIFKHNLLFNSNINGKRDRNTLS